MALSMQWDSSRLDCLYPNSRTLAMNVYPVQDGR